jgi:signal transduction histidine kinase
VCGPVPDVTVSTHDLWHPRAAIHRRRLTDVDGRGLERHAGVIGLTATLIVGGAALLGGLVEGLPQPDVHPAVWWPPYLVFVATFWLDLRGPAWQPRWLGERPLVMLQLLTAVATYLVDPGYGWSNVLVVVAAVSAAYLLEARPTTVMVVLLSGVIGVGGALTGLPPAETLLSTLVYGAFLAFATLVVHAQRRATAARTELANAHAQLRASSALLAASSATAERLRIARELHDLVGHQLTALSLELEVAGHHVDGAAAVHVGRARDVARGLLGDVREAVGELRVPPGSLAAPLEALVEDLPGLRVHLEIVEDLEVDEERRLTVVRCVQELVTNTVRHATARNLWLSVRATADGVQVSARDDGRGSGALAPGYGLTGMRERLEQLGGELHIDTGRDRGFAVTARMPAT